MNIITILLYCVSVVVAYSTSNNLGQVNDDNFKQEVLSGKYVFVDFYADWCRHCQNLMPTIEQLADTFEPYSDQLKVVKINGDKDGKRMGKKYAYKGYPTMKLFHGTDEPIEYEGGRDYESISNFLQQITKIRLPSSEIQNKEEIIKVIEQQDKQNLVKFNDFNFEEKVLQAGNKKTVVVFSATWCPNCGKLAPIFEKLADVVYASDQDIVQIGKAELDTEPADLISDQFEVKALPTVLFIDPNVVGEDGVVIPTWYKGERKLESLIEHINEFTGLSRDSRGKLSDQAGRIKPLDELIVQKLTKSRMASDKTAIGIELLGDLQEFSGKTAGQSPEFVNYYKKLINKVINGEEQFFAKELDRLNKILENDIEKLQPATVDSMQKRSNILKVFVN